MQDSEANTDSVMGPNRGPATFAVTLAACVIATAFVAARFVTRIWLVRSIKQDDWWILAAWVMSVGFAASICVGTTYGLGRHSSDISQESFASLRKAQYAFSVLYNPCLMLTKTSIIAFYLSVMSKDVDPVFKWCNWLCLAVVNIAGLALTCLNIFQCTPISAGYKFPTPQGAHCTDIVALYLSSAPVNIVTDIAILLLPMPILTGMRLPKKQKIILVVTFSAGAFVAVVDVIRIAYLQNAAVSSLSKDPSDGNGRGIDHGDFPWYASLSFMWSAIEVSVGIICACVPSLKPLFLRFLPQLLKDTTDVTPPNMSMDSDHEAPGIAEKHQSETLTILTHPAAFRKPSVMEYAGDDDGDNMGFLNMLAGPDDDAPGAEKKRRSTKMSALSRTSTANSTASDFDFVKMDKHRNMLKLSNKQSVWPIAIVTFIFFLWGFAYGLLDTLNAQFQTVAHLNKKQSLALHGAYYVGYFVSPLTLGRFILIRYGFKSTMVVGLCVYGCGTLVFWPSAVLLAFPAFIVSNFIVASGLACLEVSANPYIALCGPLEYAEVRLNLSQAIQAVGTVCSLLLAQRVLFTHVTEDAEALVSTQWAYLGISLFVFALATIFYYIPLPEATEDQMEEQADKRSAVYRQRVGPLRVVWVTLILGVFAQWCYVGAQEGQGNASSNLIINPNDLAASLLPYTRLTPSTFGVIGHTLFALGRFVGTLCNYVATPRFILLSIFVASTVLSGVQMVTNGERGVVVNMLIYFFEASIFPIVYATSMRGMGSNTKNASALMTAAISGGAIPPVIQWAVENARGLKYSYCVITAFFAFGTIFPIYLNLVPAAKKQVDPIHETRDRRRQNRRQLQRTMSVSSTGETAKFGLAGIIARRRKQKRVEHANVQHVEQTETPITPSDSLGPGAWDDVSLPSPVALKDPSGFVADLSPWEADSHGRAFDESIQHRDFEKEHNIQEISRGESSSDSERRYGKGEEGRKPSSIASHSSSNHPRKPSMSNRDDHSPNGSEGSQEWDEEEDSGDDYHQMIRGL